MSPTDNMPRVKARGHQTQWAAQFAVASELCKRGYEVAFTSGHTTPVADLMVVSPINNTMFLVDVKGLYKKTCWLIKIKPSRVNLYYVFAYVPTNDPNQFFILTQQQATQYIESKLRRLNRPDNYSMPDIDWKQASLHEDAWGVLPE